MSRIGNQGNCASLRFRQDRSKNSMRKNNRCKQASKQQRKEKRAQQRTREHLNKRYASRSVRANTTIVSYMKIGFTLLLIASYSPSVQARPINYRTTRSITGDDNTQLSINNTQGLNHPISYVSPTRGTIPETTVNHTKNYGIKIHKDEIRDSSRDKQNQPADLTTNQKDSLNNFHSKANDSYNHYLDETKNKLDKTQEEASKFHNNIKNTANETLDDLKDASSKAKDDIKNSEVYQKTNNTFTSFNVSKESIKNTPESQQIEQSLNDYEEKSKTIFNDTQATYNNTTSEIKSKYSETSKDSSKRYKWKLKIDINLLCMNKSLSYKQLLRSLGRVVDVSCVKAAVNIFKEATRENTSMLPEGLAEEQKNNMKIFRNQSNIFVNTTKNGIISQASNTIDLFNDVKHILFNFTSRVNENITRLQELLVIVAEAGNEELNKLVNETIYMHNQLVNNYTQSKNKHFNEIEKIADNHKKILNNTMNNTMNDIANKSIQEQNKTQENLVNSFSSYVNDNVVAPILQIMHQLQVSKENLNGNDTENYLKELEVILNDASNTIINRSEESKKQIDRIIENFLTLDLSFEHLAMSSSIFIVFICSVYLCESQRNKKAICHGHLDVIDCCYEEKEAESPLLKDINNTASNSTNTDLTDEDAIEMTSFLKHDEKQKEEKQQEQTQQEQKETQQVNETIRTLIGENRFKRYQQLYDVTKSLPWNK